MIYASSTMESETKHYANDYQTSERFFFVRWRPETFPNVNMKTLHRKTSVGVSRLSEDDPRVFRYRANR